jgi:signal transduction histidine kinase
MKKEQKDKPQVLLVDDERSILTELEIILCRTYDIHTFLDPEKVEEYVDNNPVDLIVCDEMMPELRGSELLSRIHKKHPDICKIVLSGQAEKNDVVKAINEGRIFSFLFKPVNRQQLLNVIEKGLENREMKILLEEQNKALKDLNDNLERKVKERTAQLVKAHKRLDQLDENKMAFLLYLSYEMTSPLDRIKRLANSIFSYFGIAGREIELAPQTVVYKKSIDEILANERYLIEERHITVENRVDEEATAQADPKYWRQILEILIHNAIVFSDRGGQITLETTAGTEGRTRFMVSDTGRGFLPEDSEAIFKPFILSQEKRHPNGFGLNLPLAKMIVEAHGGKLTGESPGPDQGATFTLEL